MALRLGLVGPVPPPNGGMAMQSAQLVRLLRSEGVNVEFLPTNPPHAVPLLGSIPGLRAGVRLIGHCLRAWHLCGRNDAIHLMANSGWSWQLFAAPVLWIGSVRRTPVIVNYRGGGARAYFERSFARVKPSLVKAAAVIVPSSYLEEVFADFGVSVQVIPNIVDISVFSPDDRGLAEAGAVPGNGARVFTFVITRNLERIYGLDIALGALARVVTEVPQARLLIAGSGPERVTLEARAEELGIAGNVEFLGRLERVAVAALYRRADAVLNPARVDNMPNSVIEALACGVPVISSNVGGVPHIVDDGETALLVPPDDEAALAHAMLRLYGDGELRQHLSSNGIAAAGRYTWQQVGPRWLATYGDVASPRIRS